MSFQEFSEFLSRLEKTASRNEITQILAELFKKADAREIDKICYLVLGRVAPNYEGLEFQLAEKMVARAIALAYKVDIEKVTEQYKKAGDLGDVASALANSKVKIQKSKLSVGQVFELLKEIALESGKDSQERKLTKMANLLSRIDPLSAKYVTRIPTGKLRLGFSDMTILDALSVLEKGDKSARKQIEAAFSVTADIGKIAQKVKVGGLEGIRRIRAEPGIPIRCALAERLASAEKIAEKMGSKFAVEPKFDGFRTQIHLWPHSANASRGKEVRIFSRNLENVTHMFPEIVSAVKKLPVESAIFDSESIAYNPATQKLLPFQDTVQRKRKHGIEQAVIDIPLKSFVFDILYLDGETLLDRPFFERRKQLEKILGKSDTRTIVLTDQEIISNAEDLRSKVDEYLKQGLEGAMVKKLDVAYQPGGRGFHWVKFKRHTENTKGEESKVTDTIDTVLMGAYAGRGKRSTFGIGGVLIGVPGGDGKYYSLTNLGTGLTDEQFREMFKIVEKLKVDKQPFEYTVDKITKPDIWVRPKVVLEVLADEITPSPRHTVGYSLRFPRLIRVRDDKNPEQATSVHEIKELYKMQTGK
ncbi:MAG: DNA ligase 1 [Microgenomates group bacterium Gr01-1014_5]|nr:MAG: DNA ligase 1 [Microgenomates group bacterium Gr01-1014_5]